MVLREAWRVNRKGIREQILTKPGDIWQDGREWKISPPKGWNLITERTKKRCLIWRQNFIKTGEDWGEDCNPTILLRPIGRGY